MPYRPLFVEVPPEQRSVCFVDGARMVHVFRGKRRCDCGLEEDPRPPPVSMPIAGPGAPSPR